MTFSVTQLSEAQAAASELLEALGLNTYRFEVEPQEAHWLVRLECGVTEGWMTTEFKVPDGLLQQSRRDPAVRERLLQTWRARLTACLGCQ